MQAGHMQGLNGRKPGEHMLFKDPIVRLARMGENGSSREERALCACPHTRMIHDFSTHRLGQNRTIHVLRLLVADHRAVIADQKVVRDAEPLYVAQERVPASARHDPESVPRTPPVRYGLKVRFAHHTVAEQGSVKIAGRYLHAASSSSTSIAEPHPAQPQGLRP